MSQTKPAIELKGRLLSLTRVYVSDADPAAVSAELASLHHKMPDALRELPVVLEAATAFKLGPVVEALRAAGLVPLGVVDGALSEAARDLQLPVFGEDAFTGGSRSAAPAVAAPVAAARRSSRIIDRPVRSGQQIYAEGGDLIVLSQVGAGAEVIADGCVHIYGTLRGRAVAGARGDEGARLFCQRFEPELVAVAGVYAVAEQMQGSLRGAAVQVWLADGKLRLEPMGA